MLSDVRRIANLIDQTLRFNADQHRNAIIVIQHLTHPRRKERHFADGAKADATELNRRARLQATNGIFEEHQVVDVVGIKRILNALLIVIQSERGFLRHGLSLIHSFRHVKAHAAAKQRGEGTHLDAHACGG